MAKMISGFTEMGVPAEQLHYEYFGPLRSTASVLAKEAAREAKTTQSAHV
jgi:ferredoxin-NADP reductase